MTSHEKHRYIQAFSRIIGVAEEKVTEYAEKKGMAALVNNAAMLLSTPTQRKKHQAFLDLYRMSSTLTQENPVLNSPAVTAEFIRSVMDKIHDKEAFVVVFVDAKMRVIDYEEVSVGSIDGTNVHPREIFRNAIVNKAYAIIVGHNHPSGDVTPSNVDIKSTEVLKAAGKLLKIPIIDHVIVNGLNHHDFYSFRDMGILEEPTRYRLSSEQGSKSMSDQVEDKYIMFISRRGNILPKIVGKEHEIVDYWRSNREHLIGWMVEGSNVPQENYDLYDMAISTHVKSVGDLCTIYDDLNFHGWYIDVVNINEISPRVQAGEYVWVEIIEHRASTPDSHIVRSQERFDNFDDAIKATSSKWMSLYSNAFERDKSAVFWVAPSRSDGDMDEDKAQFIRDLCFGCDCRHWRSVAERHDIAETTKVYEPER